MGLASALLVAQLLVAAAWLVLELLAESARARFAVRGLIVDAGSDRRSCSWGLIVLIVGLPACCLAAGRCVGVSVCGCGVCGCATAGAFVRCCRGDAAASSFSHPCSGR
eukprot:COSAG01_NODE_702_length_14141_cov_36.742739_12_plen_109_part_00